MHNFAIIGVGGFIAPRHLEAIHSLGGNIIAAYDPNDSVGIIDRYAPQCAFFTDFERFQSYLHGEAEAGRKMDFLSVCSPNYLHSSHIEFGLRFGAKVICEKPLVLKESELDRLADLEKRTNGRVFTVLQLRVHDAILKLRDQVKKQNKDRYKVKLTYMTSRGAWYHESWKGDLQKSGGLSANIGIHFFDMLTWIFGSAREATLEIRSATVEKGRLVLDRADVDWYLTVDGNNLPKNVKATGKTTYRSITIDDEEFEFSEGFTELHKKVYADVLQDKGYGIQDARAAIKLVEGLRSSEVLNG